MTPLLALLLNRLPPGAHRIGSFESVQRRLVESFGYQVVIIDIDPAGGKSDLLDLVAARLGFPTWFGRNWDALNDVLCDPNLTGVEPGDVIVLRRRQELAGRQATGIEVGDAARTMIEMFSEVAEEAGFRLLIAGFGAGREPTAG